LFLILAILIKLILLRIKWFNCAANFRCIN